MDFANWAGMWEGVEVLEPSGEQGLQVFGLRAKASSPLQYATLDEAMAAGTLGVVEVSEAGSVPNLKVSNGGPTMVFLLSGEQLLGAKQR